MSSPKVVVSQMLRVVGTFWLMCLGICFWREDNAQLTMQLGR